MSDPQLPKSEGLKYDKGKIKWSLLPWNELQEVAKVLTIGAEKYGAFNWQQLENAKARYEDALYRHITEYSKGKQKDPETGLPHLSHACCNALFLMWFDHNKK